MNNQQFAETCIALVGGKENIQAVSHCATRIRLTLRDQSKLQLEDLKKVPGVLKVMEVGSQTQIVVGTEAPEIYRDFSRLAGGAAKAGSVPAAEQKKGSLFSRFVDACSAIFTPLVPAFTAAGMVKAILAVLVACGLSNKSQEYIIINFVSDTIFYFMPIMLAFTCADRFNCNRFIAAAIGAMFVYPTFTSMVSAGEPVSFFGIPVTLYNYTSTVLPAILTVWFMSYVERFANKISPKVVKAILAPLLTMAITFPVGLLVIGPIGAVTGNLFASGLEWINDRAAFLVPTLMGAFAPFLVFVGMHRATGVLDTAQLAALGYANVSGPGQLASNIAQGASTIVLSLKSKNPDTRSQAFTAGVTALCGITEPALYGFTVKNRKSLIATVIGGAVGGFYGGVTHVVRFAKGAPGLPTLPVFIDLNNPSNLINAIITAALGFVVSFVVAWIIIKPGDVAGDVQA